MIKKRIFNKKNNQKFYFIFLIFFILFFICFFLLFTKDNSFIVSKFQGDYYVIPDDKGGIEIPNQNKKSLHLSYKESEVIINNDPVLLYSIQIFTHENYEYLKNYRLNLVNGNESIFFPNDLFISIFNSNLGTEYFLLYKNFESRNAAHEYCKQYVYFIEKCIIVNVQNLE